MDTPMNTKIRTILAAGMLLVTVLPVAACAKKGTFSNHSSHYR